MRYTYPLCVFFLALFGGCSDDDDGWREGRMDHSVFRVMNNTEMSLRVHAIPFADVDGGSFSGDVLVVSNRDIQVGAVSGTDSEPEDVFSSLTVLSEDSSDTLFHEAPLNNSNWSLVADSDIYKSFKFQIDELMVSTVER